MIIKEIKVNRYIAKSKIKGIDFVINPYVGCPNACIYCNASFLKQLSGHTEKWGTFLDIKYTNYKLKKRSIQNKTYLLSSSTDCYNLYEEKYEITKKILEELVKFDFHLRIETKNKLILRDIDLLKQFQDVKVIISLNTLEDSFRKKIEQNSTIKERLDTLKTLHQEGIYTILNICPIFPYLTNYQEIIKETKEYIQEYSFNFLTLSKESKREVLKFIKENYEEYYYEYAQIYLFDKDSYFLTLKQEIEKFCKKEKIKYFISSKI